MCMLLVLVLDDLSTEASWSTSGTNSVDGYIECNEKCNQCSL